MMKLVIYGLVIYFLYKVIFEIVVPVSKGVKTVKQNMEKMQEAAKTAEANRQSATAAQQANFTNNAANNKAQSPPTDAEYIDFEEVKK